MDLVDLVPRLKSSLTVPGSPALFQFTGSETAEWTLSLANAFWTARLAGLFTNYRVDAGGTTVVPITGTDELPEEVHQVIVLQAALVAIEMRFATLTSTKSISGDQEFDNTQLATVLTNLLNARRAELAALRDELLTSGNASNAVAFLDLVAIRHGQMLAGDGYFLT